MSLFRPRVSYNVNLFKNNSGIESKLVTPKKTTEPPGKGYCPPGQQMVGGTCKIKESKSKDSFTLAEPFGPYKDFADCMANIGGTSQDEKRRKCGALQSRLETKLVETLKKNKLAESVDFKTWVIPTPDEDLIEAEVLHVTVSGNRVDYTKEELLPAVNTLIGKPVYWVPIDEITKPDDLHHDPAKKVVGEILLARFDNNTVHALMQVEPEIRKLVDEEFITQGSIEANFMVESPSNKAIADRKPEFITFSGYLLLPREGTPTKAGPTGPPGDPMTNTKVFEQLKKQLGSCCLRAMCKGSPEKSIFF